MAAEDASHDDEPAAGDTPRMVTAVFLDPDVAAAFPDAESANAALRLILEARRLSRSTETPPPAGAPQ
jgi:hypothetical protein